MKLVLELDASDIAALCHEKLARLTKDEFCALIDWVEKEPCLDGMFQHHQIGYLTGNSFDSHPGSNPPEITDVRFICWFDN